MNKKHYFIGAFLAITGSAYALRSYFTDNTEPCVEIKTKEGKLEINISDSNSTCTERTRTAKEEGTIDTLVTYVRATNYYSNIEKVEVLVDGIVRTNIPLEKQGPNIHSLAPLVNLSYGQHEIRVEAYDTVQNKGQASLAVFAYKDGIADISKIEEDKQAPEVSKNFLGRNKSIRDNQSGIQTVEIKDKEGESLLAKVYQEYVPELDLEDLLATTKGKARTLYVSDHNGNTDKFYINLPISQGKGHIGGE